MQYGNQTIREVAQEGWTATFPYSFFGGGSHSLFVYNGQDVVDVDFGNFHPNAQTTITGTKWQDHDGDGIRDAGDEGLLGWTIYADLNLNDAFDEGEPTDETDANGDYSLALPASVTGDVFLSEAPQAGWTASIGDHYTYVYRVGAINSGEDFANYRAFGNVTGVKWEDVDGDGVRDLAGPSFSDNFDAGASLQWGNEIGNWTTSGGAYLSQAPSNSPPTYSSLPFDLVDFTVEVDINDLQDGGIWLRSTDSNNGVLLVTGGHQGEGTGLYWHIVQNGNGGSNLNEVTGLFTPDVSDAHLRIVVSVNTYSVFVNGATTPATTLTTSAFSSGHVALYSFSNQTFDNFALTTPPDEPLLAGWTIYLDADADGILDAGEPSAVTDANGAYTLTDVPAGNQVLREVPQLGWQATLGDRSVNIPLSATATANFGNRHLIPGSISGTKWNDLNGDGYRAVDEPALSGWTIYVDFNGDGDRDPGEPFAVTATDNEGTPDVNETGTYFIGNIPAGSNLWIREEPQVGWVASRGDRELYLYENYAYESVNFGNYQPIAASGIEGIKYHDHNGNGLRDEGDEPLAGWTLYVDLDNDGVQDGGEPVAVTAEVTGAYSFSGLLAGNYTVCEVMQAGYVATPGYGGTLTVFVYNSDQKSTLNFANFIPVPGSVSGVKWNDLDGNGQRSPLEPLLSGWTIFVDLNDSGTLDAGEPSAVTNVSGQYVISGLPVGSQHVAEVLQSTYVASLGNRTVFVYNGDPTVADFGNYIDGVNNPDLKVESLGTTAPDASGEFTISWTTANRGARDTAIGWTERILVRNLTTGAVVFQTEQSEAGSLAVDGTRSHTQVVTAPDGGHYEVIVTVDSHGELYEFNAVSHADAEANNAVSSFFDVFLDLEAINLTVDRPTSLRTGDTVTVNWSDRNTGGRDVEGSWYDRVLVQNLTTGETIYNQIVYHDTSSLGELAPGQSHARSHTFDLPDGDVGVGNLQITVTTDALSHIGERNVHEPEDAETNNSATSDAFAVSLAPYPDLVVTQVSLTPADSQVTDLQSGILATVKWTDSNLGTAPAGSYYDYVRVERVDAEGNVLEVVSSRVVAVNGPLEVTGVDHPALEQQYSFNLPDGPRGA